MRKRLGPVPVLFSRTPEPYLSAIRNCPQLSNLAFGPSGEHRIYVTEDEFGVIEVHDVDTSGLPLYYRLTRAARGAPLAECASAQ